MTLADWFTTHLQVSGDGFIWAVEQIPEERRWLSPPPRFGLWPVARQAYHMLNYDHNLAVPAMHQWIDDLPVSQEHVVAWESEDGLWDQQDNLDKTLDNFRQVREEQITLLAKYSDAQWQELRETVWGNVSLKWVVSKTFQHTTEHTCTVMQMALFWDK